MVIKNHAVCEIIWKNMVQPDRQTTDGNMALRAAYLGLHTHTLTICNTYCSSTAAVVARTRLNVTFYIHCRSSYKHSNVT
jgi:hypothetical protein